MTLGEIKARVWERLDDTGAAHYDAAQVTAAVNEGQELFALLTLCLERKRPIELTPGLTFYSMLARFADWIVPLRLRTYPGTLAGFNRAEFNEVAFNDTTATDGVPRKLRPAAIADLDSLDEAWQSAIGTPKRYGCAGFDLWFIYPQPVEDTVLIATYAYSPAALAWDSDVPEIPLEHHEDLIDYALYALRLADGGSQLQKGLPYFERFLESAAKLADFVRARNLAQRYDTLPFELRSFDKSALVGKAKKAA